jgi:hypothetical protein
MSLALKASAVTLWSTNGPECALAIHRQIASGTSATPRDAIQMSQTSICKGSVGMTAARGNTRCLYYAPGNGATQHRVEHLFTVGNFTEKAGLC